jgi:hypothetical protein
MTQFTTTTPRRAGGDIDVYTGLLCAAFLVLAAGVALMAMRNMDHSKVRDSDAGGIFTRVEKGR